MTLYREQPHGRAGAGEAQDRSQRVPAPRELRGGQSVLKAYVNMCWQVWEKTCGHESEEVNCIWYRHSWRQVEWPMSIFAWLRATLQVGDHLCLVFLNKERWSLYSNGWKGDLFTETSGMACEHIFMVEGNFAGGRWWSLYSNGCKEKLTIPRDI